MKESCQGNFKLLILHRGKAIDVVHQEMGDTDGHFLEKEVRHSVLDRINLHQKSWRSQGGSCLYE